MVAKIKLKNGTTIKSYMYQFKENEIRYFDNDTFEFKPYTEIKSITFEDEDKLCTKYFYSIGQRDSWLERYKYRVEVIKLDISKSGKYKVVYRKLI